MRTVKYIPEDSVVKLPDGRMGIITHNTPRKTSWVYVAENYAVEVSRNARLEVVRYPSELAREWLEAHKQ